MNTLYETKISTLKWIIYDVLGNAGWISYLIGIKRLLSNKTIYEHKITLVLLMIPAIFMIIGIIELISERIAKLDRILSRTRLWRGFGALTFGGLLGIFFSFISSRNNKDWLLMFIGSALCALFAGLCLFGYKKKKVNISQQSLKKNKLFF